MLSDQYCLIAMGGNLPSRVGEPAETIREGLVELERLGVEIQSVSPFYQTPCFPAGAGPDYVNASAKISFDGNARDLLSLLQRIEADFGRKRMERWGRRTLDLDLIAVGDAVLPDAETHAAWRELPNDQPSRYAPEQLILPHPRMQDRAFVLVPLADVAPDWMHPVLGRSVLQMLSALPENEINDVVLL